MCIPQTAPTRCQQSGRRRLLRDARVAATNNETNGRRANFNELFADSDSDFTFAGNRVENLEDFAVTATDGWQTPPERRQGATVSPAHISNEFHYDSECPLNREYVDLRLGWQLSIWIAENISKIFRAFRFDRHLFKRLFASSKGRAERTSYRQLTTRFGARHSIGWQQVSTDSDRSSIMPVGDQSEELNVSRQTGGATGHYQSQRPHSERTECTGTERSARLKLLTKSLRWAGSLAFILLISNVIVVFKILHYNAVGLPDLQTSRRVSSLSPLKSDARDDTVEQQGHGQPDLMMSKLTEPPAEAVALATATSRWQQAYDESKHYDDWSTTVHHQAELIMSTDRREQVERECLQEHDHAKHSGLLGANIYYYLLIVALMDLFSHLNWYHSRQTYNQSHRQQHHPNIRPPGQHHHHHQQQQQAFYGIAATIRHALALNSHAQSVPLSSLPQPLSSSSSSSSNWLALVGIRRASWMTVSILLVTSSKHLFQFLQVSLFVMLESRSIGKLLLFMNCLNYLNQTGKFALYLCKILYYLKIISDDSVTEANCSNENHSGLISNYLFDYPSLSGQATFESRVNGWLIAMGQDSNLSKIEKYLMMSRIFQIQLTVVALFVHLDTLPIEYSFEVIVLICSIAQAFLEMYFQYDKYYSRYWQWSMENETDDDDTDSP